MLDNVIRSFSSLPRANRWLVHFEKPPKAGWTTAQAQQLAFVAQNVTIPGKTIMTKETFGLTQPQSYGYAATVGELQMGFLVSKGSQAVSSYEMFVKWMDKIVGNAFADVSYSDDHCVNCRLKIIDQGAVKEWTYWRDGGTTSAKTDTDHMAFYATRIWPSALGNLALTMEEGILSFDVTFKVHKMLEFNTANPKAQDKDFSNVASQLATLKNTPTGELQNALNQANDIGRIAVDAFDKISQAAQQRASEQNP